MNQDFFDNDVNAELERIARTMEFALDDYYYYGYRERELSSIIEEYFLLITRTQRCPPMSFRG